MFVYVVCCKVLIYRGINIELRLVHKSEAEINMDSLIYSLIHRSKFIEVKTFDVKVNVI